jgi:hypothetical protein
MQLPERLLNERKTRLKKYKVLKMSNGLMSLFSNPQTHFIKKTMFELLRDRYAKHEQIVERISHSMVTEKDTKDFLQMMVDIYEIGFMKAVEEQREKLAQLGYDVKITGRTN